VSNEDLFKTYTKSGGAKCPFCSASSAKFYYNTSGSAYLYTTGLGAEVPIKCLACLAEWYDVMQVVSIKVIRQPARSPMELLKIGTLAEDNNE